MGRDQEKTLIEVVGQNAGVYIQQSQDDNIEDAGLADIGPGPAINEAIEKAAQLERMKREKISELKNRVRELRHECEQWGIPEHEVGL